MLVPHIYPPSLMARDKEVRGRELNKATSLPAISKAGGRRKNRRKLPPRYSCLPTRPKTPREEEYKLDRSLGTVEGRRVGHLRRGGRVLGPRSQINFKTSPSGKNGSKLFSFVEAAIICFRAVNAEE